MIMLFGKRKKHVAKSSRQWRELVYNAMLNDGKLNVLLTDGLLSITKLVTTIDSEDARLKIKEYVLASNEKKIQGLVDRIPLDFDECSYPLINLFILKNRSGQYIITIAETADFSQFTFVDIIKGEFISENKFETVMRVFPI